ncbi:hypothetical protein [Anaeromyxobacter diazotrophicus]|uniref:Uncharacterized protein n=1 Tax=Anaeromyxobacter diazotrophicus TaxID=2590199 RepID=A0A7I9VRA6_9BACT|nr:hypothetical protein [Anaeromyxobacter diazotrophicus]GEJ58945.1 hypothetical protein AMYX_36860 [Anaeromyxobacter diazotrophicus]
MSPELLDRAAAGLGRPAALAAAAAAGLGAAALVAGAAAGLAAPALAALAASWLFFAGCAAGGLALAAAVRVAGGRWASAVLPIADASAGFFLPALLLLAVLVLAARGFVPWVAEGEHLVATGLVLRQLAATALLFGAGARFVGRVRRGEAGLRVGRAGVLYLLLFALVLSLWAYDFAIALDEGPAITVLPAFYFMGAFLSGVAWVGLVTAVRGADEPDTRHDVGKLLFGLLILWTYLLWSIFLPTWYGNVPEESVALLARWRAPWKAVSIAVLALVSAGPFWLLFAEPLKRRRATLAAGAGAVLLGLAAERVLLVLPSLRLPGGPAAVAVGALVMAGVLGSFLLAVGARLGASGLGAHRDAAP